MADEQHVTVPATGPRRIQLRRTAGWRKPEGSVLVSRPSRWGNPFQIRRVDCSHSGMFCWTVADDTGITREHLDSKARAAEVAVDLFRLHIGPMGSHEYDAATMADLAKRLAGRDLCCWCPPEQACHADVLMDLANG